MGEIRRRLFLNFCRPFFVQVLSVGTLVFAGDESVLGEDRHRRDGTRGDIRAPGRRVAPA